MMSNHYAGRSAWARLAAATSLVFVLLAGGAQAQEVSQAQLAAIKSNCRSDFMSNCMSVRPGGKEALACLQQHMAKLSPACGGAVAATMPKAPPPAAAMPPPPPAPPKPAVAVAPPPPPAPPPVAVSAPPPKAAAPRPSAAQKDALGAACSNDYLAHCASVPPGGKEALACLRQHAMALSVPCKEVLSKMMATRPPARKKTVHAAPPPPPPPPAPVAVAAAPTPEQMKAVKYTCRNDFRARCRGVPAGGQEAMACLMRNSARLSPDCKTSLRAIEESMPMAPAAAAAAPAPPTPEQQAAL
jgi:hypothetical protein